MINTPPPTVPGSVPAPAQPLPQVAIAAEIQQVTDQLSAVLAAMKQQAVLAVTKAEIDAAKQLLTLLTPQGGLTVKLPPVAPNTPVNSGPTAPTSPLPQLPVVQLPSGQTMPLGDVLTQLASLPPATLKNIFLQFDKPLVPGQLPPLKILLNPADLNTGRVPTTPPITTAGTPTTPLNLIRTTLTPLPESAVRDLGLLNMPSKPAGAPTNQPPSVIDNALTAVKTKVSSLISRMTDGQVTMTAPQPISVSSAARPMPLALNTRLPVEVLPGDIAGATPATVLGATPKGEAIVRTDAGQIFSLANVRATAIGSSVYLRNTAPIAAGGVAMPAETESLDKLLNDMVRILNTIDPALAARVSQQLQATPGPQMGGALMMIFSVLAGGALTGRQNQRQITLSEAVDKAMPEGAKTRLLQALNDDPINSTRLVPDTIGMEWRGHQLPTPQLQGFTGPVWFYVQQQRQDQFNGSGSNQQVDTARQTRFVIDMDFTRLGHTQLEGIAAPQRLDVKINIGAPLPAAMQKELRDVYANAVSGYGLNGALTFSTDAPIDLDGPHDAMQVIS